MECLDFRARGLLTKEFLCPGNIDKKQHRSDDKRVPLERADLGDLDKGVVAGGVTTKMLGLDCQGHHTLVQMLDTFSHQKSFGKKKAADIWKNILHLCCDNFDRREDFGESEKKIDQMESDWQEENPIQMVHQRENKNAWCEDSMRCGEQLPGVAADWPEG